jgi:rubrerythrin
MSEKIRKNIAEVFSQESKASDRNAAFALQAEKEGFPGLARLFRAVSDGKATHSRRFRLLMREKIGTTMGNLLSAYQSEVHATEETYPEMVRTARDGSTAVQKAFIQSARTDGEYAALFEEALKDMKGDPGKVYYVCQICGHISQGFVPENCPVCHAVRGRYKEIF